jgi:hypothetical protein
MSVDRPVGKLKSGLLTAGVATIVVASIAVLCFRLDELRLFPATPRPDAPDGAYYVRKPEDFKTIPQSAGIVWIDYFEVTDEDLAEFLEGRDLTSLTVEGCERITERGLAPLRKHPRLAYLNASNTSVGNGIGEVLSGGSALLALKLGDTQLTELPEVFFAAHKKLESLSLGHCKLTKQMIIRCATHTELSSLDLENCTEVLPSWLAQLGQSHCLSELNLAGTNLDHQSLASIMAIPSLELISLRDVLGITTEEIQALQQQHPAIEFVEFWGD